MNIPIVITCVLLMFIGYAATASDPDQTSDPGYKEIGSAHHCYANRQVMLEAVDKCLQKVSSKPDVNARLRDAREDRTKWESVMECVKQLEDDADTGEKLKKLGLKIDEEGLRTLDEAHKECDQANPEKEEHAFCVDTALSKVCGVSPPNEQDTTPASTQER